MSFFAQKQRGVFSEVLDPTLPSEYNVRNYDQGPPEELVLSTISRQSMPKAVSLQRLQTASQSRGVSRQSGLARPGPGTKKTDNPIAGSVEPKVSPPH